MRRKKFAFERQIVREEIKGSFPLCFSFSIFSSSIPLSSFRRQTRDDEFPFPNVTNAFAIDRFSSYLPTLFSRDLRAISQKTYGESRYRNERFCLHTFARRMMRYDLWSVQNKSFAVCERRANFANISERFDVCCNYVCHIRACKYFKYRATRTIIIHRSL